MLVFKSIILLFCCALCHVCAQFNYDAACRDFCHGKNCHGLNGDNMFRSMGRGYCDCWHSLGCRLEEELEDCEVTCRRALCGICGVDSNKRVTKDLRGSCNCCSGCIEDVNRQLQTIEPIMDLEIPFPPKNDIDENQIKINN